MSTLANEVAKQLLEEDRMSRAARQSEETLIGYVLITLIPPEERLICWGYVSGFKRGYPMIMTPNGELPLKSSNNYKNLELNDIVLIDLERDRVFHFSTKYYPDR